MCTKQTSYSHSSAEAEVISLDIGLRMDGIPVLGLSHLVIVVFHSSPKQINKSKGQESEGKLSRNTTLHIKNQNPTRHVNLDLNNVVHVSSNVRSSHFGALLYFCEDNEAVIKMMIKGRSPTMRHVLRTHSIALNWLFDGINRDPKIQIRYIDISHFSSLFCANCSKTIKPPAMIQAVTVSTCSSSVHSPIAPKSLGILESTGWLGCSGNFTNVDV